MGFFAQLKWLLWKNYVLRKRQKIRAIVEFVWPLLLFLILVLVRTEDLVERNQECRFVAKALPSSGFLNFLQSYLCTFKNECHEPKLTDVDVGVSGERDRSLLSFFLQSLSPLSTTSAETTKNSVETLLTNFSELQALGLQLSPTHTNYTALPARSFFKNADTALTTFTENGLNRSAGTTFLKCNVEPPAYATIFVVLLENYRALAGLAQQRIDIFSIDIDGIKTALNEIRRRLFCDTSNLHASFACGNESSLLLVGDAFCRLTDEQWMAIMMESAYSANLNTTAFAIGAINAVRNITGVDFTMKFFTEFITASRGLSTSFTKSPFAKVVGEAQEWQKRARVAQSSENSSSLLAYLTCSQFDLGLSAAFQSSGNVKKLQDLRDKYVGQGAAEKTKKTAADDDFDEPKAPSRENQTGNTTTSPQPPRPIRYFCAVDGVTQHFIEVNKTADMKCRTWMKSFGIPSRFVSQLQALMRGHILVSPASPIVVALVEKLQTWLTNVETTQMFIDGVYRVLNTWETTVQNSTFARSASNYLHSVEKLLDAAGSGENSTEGEWFRGIVRLGIDLLEGDPTMENSTVYQLRRNITIVRRFFDCFETKRFVVLPSEFVVEKLGKCLVDFDLLFAGLVFDHLNATSDALEPLVTYKIRMDASLVDNTFFTMDRLSNPRPRSRPLIDTKYLYYGFSFLQDAVDRAIIELQTNKSAVETAVFAQQFPNPCFQVDLFIEAIKRTTPLFMIIAWLYTASMIVKCIVLEKEQRLKEFMKVMGLSNAVHWVAWFISCFATMFTTAVVLVLIIKFGRVVQRADVSVLLALMASFTFSTISLCFLMSTLFQRANLAAACAGIAYFVLFLPYPLLLNFDDVLSTGQKGAWCLISNVAFGYCCNYMALWEDAGVGLRWSNIRTSPKLGDNFTFAFAMAMLVIDGVIYLLLTWYIEGVWPGEFGIAKPWYFPFQLSYWFPTTKFRRLETQRSLSVDAPVAIEASGSADTIEADPTALKLGVSVRRLKKVYGNGKVAVNGLSLNFYEGQITSFLGHNGAGKTTTLSIMTGLLQPSTGTVRIYNRDIRTEIDLIRQSLGMCPQHSVLFPFLSCSEQLRFYGGLKGLSGAALEKAVNAMLIDLNLDSKRDSLPDALSGGMQRKLSISVALIGDSKTVVLDEPTAGLDPFARRGIWDLLLRHKEGRTIILSTHHMDEADVLGDRIAIISDGELRCVGSSLFLKKRYSSGYYLTLVKQPVSVLSTSGGDFDLPDGSVKKTTLQPLPKDLFVKPHAAAVDVPQEMKQTKLPPIKYKDVASERIVHYVQSKIVGTQLVEDVGAEVRLTIPANNAEDLQLFFTDLDRSLEELGVASYGISDTSLEEIFLKVVGLEQAEAASESKCKVCCPCCFGRMSLERLLNKREKKDVEEASDANDSDEELVGPRRAGQANATAAVREQEAFRAGHAKTSDCHLIRRQFFALMLKRFNHFRRSLKGAFCEILLPALFVTLSLVLSLLRPPATKQLPPLVLVPWLYTNNNVFYSRDGVMGAVNNESIKFVQGLLTPPGIGTRCMANEPLKEYSESWACGAEKVAPSLFKLNGSVDPPAPIRVGNCECDDQGIHVCPEEIYSFDPPSREVKTGDIMWDLTSWNISDYLVDTEQNFRRRRYGGFSLGHLERVTTELQHDSRKALAFLRANLVVIEDGWSNFTTDAGFELPPLPTPLDENCTLTDSCDEVDNDTIIPQLVSFPERFMQLLSGATLENSVKVWFNNKGWAALPAYANVMSNAMLRALLPSGREPMDYGIVTVNYPMNYSRDQLIERAGSNYNIAMELTKVVAIIMAFSFVPASFVLFLIEERTSTAKHLQFVSGVNQAVYWFATFTWDMINYAIPVFCCLVIFALFKEDAYLSSPTVVVALIVLFFLFGFAVTPFMYLGSFAFRVQSLAFLSLACLNVFLGMVTTITVSTLDELSRERPDLGKINDVLRVVFLIFPQYCFGRSLLDLKYAFYLQKFEAEFFDKALAYSPFEWGAQYALGDKFFCMFCFGLVAFSVVLFVEYRCCCLSESGGKRVEVELREADDVDVATEREKVLAADAEEYAIRTLELTKVYRTGVVRRKELQAVDKLCLGVGRGECFGLLGMNGAGKTSCFKMLTGKTRVTSGDALVNGFSVKSDVRQVYRSIGYCPQSNALNALLSGREHLEFYARLRGVEESHVAKVAQKALKRMNLLAYADKTAGTYSGGNMRKLSAAIAMIGNPSIVLLDEPTAGMDPKARRFLWDRIVEVVKDGRSVVLTSHSMEECEALCNRIGIMVRGRLKCIGSLQHLKSRYGEGYTLTVKLTQRATSPPTSPTHSGSGAKRRLDAVATFVESSLRGASLKESHATLLQYQLPPGLAVADIFRCVQEGRRRFGIEEYSLSQTTLDQIFISFARHDADESCVDLKAAPRQQADEAGVKNGAVYTPSSSTDAGSRVRAAHEDFPLNDRSLTLSPPPTLPVNGGGEPRKSRSPSPGTSLSSGGSSGGTRPSSAAKLVRADAVDATENAGREAVC